MYTKSLPSLALIGCGDWGKNIARTALDLGVLAGIVDHSPSLHAKSFMEAHRVPLLSFDDVIKGDTIDGVMIATPTPTHYALAKAALEAGKHVYVEKPMVYSIEENDTLEKLAAQKSSVLMVGHLLLYHPAFNLVEELVKKGTLGEILSVASHRMNFGKILGHEGVLWDLAPHDLSMVLALLPRPNAVMATESSYIFEGMGDTCSIHFSYDSALHATIRLSRLHPFKEQKLIIVGTKGMVVFDDTREWREKVCFYDTWAKKTESGVDLIKHPGEFMELPPFEPLRLEIEHFMQCIVKKKMPRSSGASARDILNVLLAAEKSITEKTWVSL